MNAKTTSKPVGTPAAEKPAETAPAAAAEKPVETPPAEKPAETPAVQKPAAPAPKAETVEPLYALHRIVYGDQKTALAETIFFPTTAAERKDILKLEAARELDEVELAVAAQLRPAPFEYFDIG